MLNKLHPNEPLYLPYQKPTTCNYNLVLNGA